MLVRYGLPRGARSPWVAATQAPGTFQRDQPSSPATASRTHLSRWRAGVRRCPPNPGRTHRVPRRTPRRGAWRGRRPSPTLPQRRRLRRQSVGGGGRRRRPSRGSGWPRLGGRVLCRIVVLGVWYGVGAVRSSVRWGPRPLSPPSSPHDSAAVFYRIGLAQECQNAAGAICRGVIARTAYHGIPTARDRLYVSPIRRFDGCFPLAPCTPGQDTTAWPP